MYFHGIMWLQYFIYVLQKLEFVGLYFNKGNNGTAWMSKVN